MEVAIERLTALVLLIVGLSHALSPRAWSTLFDRIGRSGETAGLAIAAIHLPLGLLIVSFHNVWSWPQLIVTIIGWASLIKGSAHLLIPDLAHRGIALGGSGETGEGRYRIAGLIAILLGLAVGWIALR